MLGTLTFVLLTATAATPCENLKSISLPNTAITISEFVPEQQQPGNRGGRGDRGRGAPEAGSETRGRRRVQAAALHLSWMDRGGFGVGGLGGREPGRIHRWEPGDRTARTWRRTPRSTGLVAAAAAQRAPTRFRPTAVWCSAALCGFRNQYGTLASFFNRWNGIPDVWEWSWGGSIRSSGAPEALRTESYAAAPTRPSWPGEFALGHRRVSFCISSRPRVTVQSKVLIKISTIRVVSPISTLVRAVDVRP